MRKRQREIIPYTPYKIVGGKKPRRRGLLKAFAVNAALFGASAAIALTVMVGSIVADSKNYTQKDYNMLDAIVAHYFPSWYPSPPQHIQQKRVAEIEKPYP